MTSGFTLDPNEKIIAKVNRHWFDLMPVAASSGVMVILVFVLVYVFARYGSRIATIPTGLIALIVLILLLLAAVILVFGVWVYRQNYLLLTNRHLIQVVQSGLFNRQVSQTSLARVQDVSGHRAGLLATLLDFGDVEVQSASEQEKFIFRNAPHPQQLADQCILLHDQFLRDEQAAGIPVASE
jgi:membrane protein YdbS with pleckstrin-like domain